MYETLKILIAEDEFLVALDLKQTLQKLGFNNISIAHNGKEALNNYYDQNPDIILLDIMMEHRMDGIEAANKIRSDNGSKAIIFITASSDKATYEEAMKVNPVEIINKPYSKKELYNTIQKAVKDITSADPKRFPGYLYGPL